MSLIPWRKKSESDGGDVMTSAPLARLRRDVDSLFDRLFHDPWTPMTDLQASGLFGGFPRTDVEESENEVTVTMEIPGVTAKDVEINISNGMLHVSGEKKGQREEKDRNYHFVEREYGSFRRSVQLPNYINEDKVDAACKDGVLTIKVGKKPDAKPRRISVKAT